MRESLHRRSTALLWAVALSLLGSGGLIPVASRGAETSSLRCSAIVRAVRKARPSVVNIKGRKTVRSDGSDGTEGDLFRQVNGMGTGIIIDPRGYILTNYHVVENVELIQVTLADRRGYVARLVARDPVSDLAMIKIDVDDALEAIDIGVSSDLMLGEEVIAIGNAFGYEHTVTRGIISALHREVQVSATQSYEDLIQTDASINPGNSGGPLLNVDGRMVGINVAVRVGAQGIGFAMPVDQAIEIAARLLDAERIDGAAHGVIGKTEGPGGDRCFVVTGIRAGSAAEKCGLQPNDVIAAVDQTSIHRALDFQRAMLGRRQGEPIELLVRRNGQPRTIALNLSAGPTLADEFGRQTWTTLGMRLAPLRPNESRALRLRYRGGMKIVAVRSDGPAARQGIRVGDVLVGMHVWETISKNNVLFILNHKDFAKFRPIKFFILRGNETLYGYLDIDGTEIHQVARTLDRG